MALNNLIAQQSPINNFSATSQPFGADISSACEDSQGSQLSSLRQQAERLEHLLQVLPAGVLVLMVRVKLNKPINLPKNY